jgi:uncharacterized protein YktA (UPF0223 family)
MRTQCDGNASKVKESKVKESKVKDIYGEFQNVLLSSEEYKKLTDKFGESTTKSKIEILSSGIASKGYKYKSHYATILSWDRMDEKRSKPNNTKQFINSEEHVPGLKIRE